MKTEAMLEAIEDVKTLYDEQRTAWRRYREAVSRLHHLTYGQAVTLAENGFITGGREGQSIGFQPHQLLGDKLPPNMKRRRTYCAMHYDPKLDEKRNQ
jgi:hypothetical protein